MRKLWLVSVMSLAALTAATTPSFAKKGQDVRGSCSRAEKNDSVTYGKCGRVCKDRDVHTDAGGRYGPVGGNYCAALVRPPGKGPKVRPNID
jgi:hypothetical protein